MQASTQHRWAQARGRMAEIEPRTQRALAGLSATHFTTVPPDAGWSVAQVFEHLCVANADYLEHTLPEGVAKARQSRHGTRDWKPSLLGGLLIASMRETSRTRLPSPKPWRVGRAVRTEVVKGFLAGIAQLREHVRELDGSDLRVGVASPLSPLLRMNIGDACVILVEHTHRHLAQVERTRRAVGG